VIRAVLFDFSGTLFRLEEDDSWFDGITVDEKAVDSHVQAELMRRVTAPTGSSVPMSEEQQHNWAHRDLEPHLHREAYLHVLRESGLTGADAAALYPKLVDPASWTPYPDTPAALNGLREAGIKTAVAAAGTAADEYVLSFEVGAVKPDPAIFDIALSRLGVEPADALMVGDSEEADGGARALGCAFALVDPLPTAQRLDGLTTALRTHGLSV